ncbi:Transposon Ty3-G Gag-Pol polyprotein [Dictyocoela roeselum]|nr:Transposon Ty3-G Gag-Pol polyprotein [Dictyocoela roeselum]
MRLCMKCYLCKEKTVKYGTVKGNISAENWLDVISSDIFGPIKMKHFKSKCKREYFYIIAFTDVYSRYTLIDIIYDITTKTIVKSFATTVINKLGIPKSILTDQGRQYISQKFNTVMSNYGIKHIFSSTHNLTGNSISERTNKTIGDVCRMYKGETLHELKEKIETRINTTYHRILGTSPFELLNKYSAIDPLKRILNVNKNISHEKIEQRNNVIRTNKKRKMHKYKVGEKIFKKAFDPNKINDLYSGPFTILKINNDKNYVIIQKNKKVTRQNIKNITPFLGEKGKMSCPTFESQSLDNNKKGLKKIGTFKEGIKRIKK